MAVRLAVALCSLLLAVAALFPAPARATDLFFADFQSGVPAQFSEKAVFRLDNIKALGLFNNKNRKRPSGVTLTLEQLPAGKPLELRFDLYLVGNWESRGQRLSDRFTVHANEQQVFLLDQFPCKILNNDETQTVDALGMVVVKEHVLGYWKVPVRVDLPAALVKDGALELDFYAKLTGKGTEFWALDDVRVRVAE
ncbi:hypothetical protein [Megalodesulfovibrio gigas]|uniref:Lipoprotein n=1 Tax=Megalodesulfovibrio gigas (strain ATCC 19364 / DSM 1382 / NCIMB 9332 / VKM B-1759) TaxID=1121448 RepID=T2G7U4_MEGG1|nr:hypothetical protein [Megalodesulfovibrio gigas]AGW12201.1 hypothetical protein DGI_0270 [Megalodesulfovibrio gigas DSM 1382 = ATCC 19364]